MLDIFDLYLYEDTPESAPTKQQRPKTTKKKKSPVIANVAAKALATANRALHAPAKKIVVEPCAAVVEKPVVESDYGFFVDIDDDDDLDIGKLRLQPIDIGRPLFSAAH
mmetsp:Transcript_22325/g.68725  ORF Transcript_22325/g.68725 Transcript_22325/m.68725 type:complete len:109 (-) Transcript_22325:358-684(-)